MNIPNLNYLHARLILQTLARCGAKHVVISPGSRSTPLAHTAMSMSELQKYVLIDERSAAFFALGLAKASGTPALLICTSGTAAANYFPAVIEAGQSFTPLIALTADRPAALRHTGAPQTIDQFRLYGEAVRNFVELPPVSDQLAILRGIRDSVTAACLLAISDPAGAVQINVPLDEPLIPVEQNSEKCLALWKELERDTVPSLKKCCALRLGADPTTLDAIHNAQAGLIIAGPGAARNSEERDAIYKLSRQLGWPLLADVVSGLRFCGEPVIPYYDIFLRNEALTKAAPDCVLAFGAHPISKALNNYLDAHRAAFTIRVQPHNRVQDPTQRAHATVVTDVEYWCTALTKQINAARDSWLLDPFQRASHAIHAALSISNIANDAAAELAFVHSALAATSRHSTVVLANSMSVRYADSVAAHEGRTFAACGMRGANGIDGTIAHAAGVAAAAASRVLLICGDLAFLHDLGGLFAVKNYARKLDILLLNNNGGGIFNLMPVANATEFFEQTHGTPLNLNLQAAVDMFGLAWKNVKTPTELQSALAEPATNARVFEAQTSRAKNRLRQSYWMEQLSSSVS